MRALAILITLMSMKALSQVQYEYPELLVSPSASETLEKLAREEVKDAWSVHIWSQIPAVINLWSGYRAMSETNEMPKKQEEIRNSGLIGMSLSGGWLVVSAGISNFYSPYKTNYRQIRKIKGDTKRDKLVMERQAEEALYEAYQFGLKLKYTGSIVNILASGIVLSQTKDQNTQAISAIGLISSFLPILFPYPWISSYDRHLEYKKKIYGPISEVQPIINSNGIGSQFSLTWVF